MVFLPKEDSWELQGRKDSWTGEDREAQGRGEKGPGKDWARYWEKLVPPPMQTALEYRRRATHTLCALSLEEKDQRGVRVPVSGVFGVYYRAISLPAAPTQISCRRDSPGVR